MIAGVDKDMCDNSLMNSKLERWITEFPMTKDITIEECSKKLTTHLLNSFRTNGMYIIQPYESYSDCKPTDDEKSEGSSQYPIDSTNIYIFDGNEDFKIFKQSMRDIRPYSDEIMEHTRMVRRNEVMRSLGELLFKD